MIVQPSISRVNSSSDLLLLFAFMLVEYLELPSFPCACLSSSRRCKHL